MERENYKERVLNDIARKYPHVGTYNTRRVFYLAEGANLGEILGELGQALEDAKVCKVFGPNAEFNITVQQVEDGWEAAASTWYKGSPSRMEASSTAEN